MGKSREPPRRDRRDPPTRSRGARAFGYCRVSGSEQGQHGTSLEAQQEEIRRYCQARGFSPPELFVEVESGARKRLERRVELARLTAELRAGDVVIVTRLDRWSRDIVHAVESIRELDARGVRWLSIGEAIDASTPHGKTTLGLIAWAAEYEHQRIRERMVGSRKALRDLGQYVEGPAPVGYQRGPGRKLEVVPAEAEIIRELFRRCARGESLREVARSLAAEYDFRRTWQPLHRMLRNRVYLGEVKTSRGEWIPSHVPIISARQWQRAQEGLARRKLGGRAPSDEALTATWLFRGIAVCALCGRRIGGVYGERTGNQPGPYLGYYACRGKLDRAGCTARNMRVDGIDEAAASAVLDRLGELREELATPPAKAAPAASRESAIASQRRRLEQRRERLLDLAESGDIGRDVLRHRLERIAAELAAVEAAEAAAAARQAVRSPKVRREMLRDVAAIERAWARATVAWRRDIVVRLAERIELEHGKPPAFAWRPVEALREKSDG